jgi:hypothetical protein
MTEQATPCPITFAVGFSDMPCRLPEGHDGDHELNDTVTFSTEWAAETHEARRISLTMPEEVVPPSN